MQYSPNHLEEAKVLAEGEQQQVKGINPQQEAEKALNEMRESIQTLNEEGRIQDYMGATIHKQTIPADFSKETFIDIHMAMTINAAAGNKMPETAEELETQIMRQTKIDLLECLELLHAVVVDDKNELMDALSDKRVTLNGFATILQESLSEHYAGVVDALHSRFDSHPSQAVKTQLKYQDMGVKTIIEENFFTTVDGNKRFFCNKVAEDATSNTGEFFLKGKFVKSVNYADQDYQSPETRKFENTSEKRWLELRKVLTNFLNQMDREHLRD